MKLTVPRFLISHGSSATITAAIYLPATMEQVSYPMSRRWQLIAPVTCWLLAFACAQIAIGAVSIDMTLVGNAGNSPDTRYIGNSVGAVDHVYRIGTYEITAGQYTEFLNAVAKADPNSLYNTKMSDTSFDLSNGLGANIQRTGSSSNYSYSVPSDWANRPVNYVSFWDAARFANWLHNGQPTGAQGPGTTEDGAYHDVGNQTLFGRNAGAKFFIPNEDEWYKAAYHNQAAGLAASYFDYPTGTNVVPGNNINESTKPGNNTNYLSTAIGSPYYRTIVGEFELSDSTYGTFDQGGNVAEWNETLLDPGRGLRGGAWASNNATEQHAQGRGGSRLHPNTESALIGFRVASIPEPSTLLLMMTALATVTIRRGRTVRRNHV
jgi:formylglycine-generating enzyme